MLWHRVEIRGSDVADLSAKALMNRFERAYRAGAMPANARVLHRRSSGGDHLYYFSPEASAVAGDLLGEFGAVSCSEEPDLSGFRPVPF